MKTKDLIRLLQEADPTGEEHCCIDNADISGVCAMSAYYDGCLQVVERVEGEADGRPLSATRVHSGVKINISPMPISELLLDCPRLRITYNDYTEKYRSRDDADRQRSIDVSNSVEKEHFEKWVLGHVGLRKDHAVTITERHLRQRVTAVASQFYRDNMSFDDPMPADIIARGMPLQGLPGESWATRREMQWAREFEVTPTVDSVAITKRIVG